MFTVPNPLALIREYRQSSLADGPQWLIDAWGGPRTQAGERISVDGSLAIADVFSAVNIICEDVSTCPLKVYRNLSLSPGNPGQGIIEASEHRAYPMLHDRPNSFTPAHRFWSTVAGHQLLWGNWYLEKFRGLDGLVEELRVLDPPNVDVEFSELSGQKRFWIHRRDGTKDGPFGPDRILHGFGYSKNGLVGMSPITQAREALGTALARRHYESDVYTKPSISGVVEHPKQLKSGSVKLRESWRAIYGTGSKDRHGIAVLEEGATFKPITAPLADMQFIESAQLSKTEIAVLFKLPPSYLGGSTGTPLTYATVEGNRIQKASEAIAPVVNNIAKFLSADVSIFPFPSWYCEFVLEGLMRGEPKARAEYLTAMKTLLNLDPEWIAQRENIPLSAIKEPEPVPEALIPSDAEPMIAVNGTED